MRHKRDSKSIIYVNFSPYENAGNILDYILDTFGTVLLFSFNFHKLGAEQSPSMLTIYKNGSIVHKNRLFQSPNSPSLAFILLPIRSIIILFQIFYHTYRFRNKYGPFDIYFTVNAFIAWTGIVLKRLNLVKKTIFWIWDYYPPIHKNKIIMLIRWTYWLFDGPASIYADRTVFLNNTMYLSRKKMGILPNNESAMVGIGTNPVHKLKTNTLPLKLVFIGVIKQSQGLDIIFNSTDKLIKIFPHISLTIIGGGPDEKYYKKRAKETKLETHFSGYIKSPEKIRKLISGCHIGVAPYVPERGNVSYFGDPSKIKEYLSCGLPVVTTNVFNFSKEITKSGAGIVIPYQEKELLTAITTIMKNYSKYQTSSLRLANKYYYKNLYKKLLN